MPDAIDAFPVNMRPFEGLLLRCPQCSGSAAPDGDSVACRSCGAVFPNRNGSLDFMGPYEWSASPVDVDAVAERVRAIFDLPASAREAVREAIAASAERTGVPHIDAEIRSLPSRFGIETAEGASDPARDGGPADTARAEPPLTFIGHYMPPTVQAGATVYRSVRFRAETTLHAQGAARTELAYEWQPARRGLLRRWWTAPDRSMAQQPSPTGLPIDVAHGREITLPIKLQAPAKPGSYELRIFPIARDLTATTARLCIPVVVEAAARLPNVQRGPTIPDYGKDHLAGVEFLQEFVAARHGSGIRILEIASGVNPHTVPLATANLIVASDICSNQMQLGAIYARHKLPAEICDHLAFASFDAFNAPFQPGQFDGVVLFSALHHFPDPSAFLRRLSDLVQPDGFIAVLCEPSEPSSASDAYVRDLSAGINEQVFAIEEYLQIFAAADLEAASIRDDGGSLKAILTKSSRPAGRSAPR